MKISDLGEFNLIEKFSQRFVQHLDPGIVGIGDDCAVIPWSKNESLVVTTDALVEDIHFIKNLINPQDLGYKSLAVNLSDIAAMGAIPTYAFLSLALPKNIEMKWVDLFFEGLGDLADEFNVMLLGGDTTSSKQAIMMSLTLLGRALTDDLKFRSSAKSGDKVCVVGNLGDSAAGLKAIVEKKDLNDDINDLIKKHYRPRIYLREAQWLAKQKSVHAMIDISDGINSDIKHVMKKSNCGSLICLDQLPTSEVLKRTCIQSNWNLNELAVDGGEDYGLLITVDSADFSEMNTHYKNIFGKSLHPIGQVTGQVGELEYQMNGSRCHLKGTGFDHFAIGKLNEVKNGR